MMKTIAIQSAAAQTPDLTKIVENSDGGARDLAMLKALQLDSAGRSKPQKNLTQVVVNRQVTRKTRVALAILPEWAPYIPPYNLARITALSRDSGFETVAYDINAVCYSRIDQAYWSGYTKTGYGPLTVITPMFIRLLNPS